MMGADGRVLALATARAADAFANSFLIVVLPLYLASELIQGSLFGLQGAAAIGIVLGLLGFVHSSLQPIIAATSDRIGRRQVFVLVGLGLLAAANLAYAWTNTLLGVVAVRILQGVALGFAIPTTITLVSEFSTQRTRGASMGMYNTLRLIGYGTGPILAGLIVHEGPYAIGSTSLLLSGFEASFLVAALAALLGFAVVAVFVRDPDTLEATVSSKRGVRLRSRESERWLDPVFTLAVCTFFVAISLSLIASIENEINARLDQSPVWFGVQFSLFLVPHIILQTPVGRLSDRRGRLPFVLGGLALTVPTTLIQGFVATPWQLAAARLGQGFATALFFSPGLAMAGDLARDTAAGTDMSMLTTAFGLGVATGPIAAGFLVGFGFATPFTFASVLCLLALGLVATQLSETVESPAGETPRLAGTL